MIRTANLTIDNEWKIMTVNYDTISFEELRTAIEFLEDLESGMKVAASFHVEYLERDKEMSRESIQPTNFPIDAIP